jgi:curved DNA-binding protein CbpA
MAQELDLRTRIEVETLHDVLEEVSYYALLQVPPEAELPAIEGAFAAESRRFHPDRFFGVRDPVFLRKLTAIYRKTSEAYSVLRDQELRTRYDEKLGIVAGEAGLNKQALESEAATAGKARQMVCTTRQGRRYYDLAKTAQRKGDVNGMVMNLQFALSFEPGNDTLQQLLLDGKGALEEKKAKQAFKVRLR